MFILMQKAETGNNVNNTVNLIAYSKYKKTLKEHDAYLKVLPIMKDYLNKLQKFTECDNIAVMVMMLEMDIEEIKHSIDNCRAKLFELEKELHE